MIRWTSAVILMVGVICATGQAPGTADRETLRRERDHLLRRSHDQHRLRLFDEAIRNALEVVRLTAELDGRESRPIADSLDWVLQLHMDRDDYRAAGKLSRELLDLHRKLDRDRPWVIRDAEVFDRYIRRVLEMNEQDVARLKETARDLQHVDRLSRFGKRDEALKLVEETLGKRKQLLGFIDHMYSRYLALQATMLLSSGRDEAAGIKLMEEAIATLRTLYGEQHRDCAAALQGLALVHRKRGDLDKAAKLLDQAADSFRTVLGKEHQTSTRAVEILAQVLRRLSDRARDKGDLRGSARYLEQEILAWQKRYAKDHWRVHDAESMLRGCRFLEKLTPPQQKTLNEGFDRFEQAMKTDAQGKTRLALALTTQTVEDFQGLLPGHALHLKALWNQAVLYAKVGEREKADAAYRHCIEQTRAELGVGHPDLIARLDEFQSGLSERLRRHIARSEFKEAVRILRLSGEFEQLRHPGQTWRLKTVQARITHLERRAKLSEKDQERLVRSDRLMDESLELFQKNQFPAAREGLSKAAAIREELLGELDYETADALYSLASVDVRLGNFPEAARNLRRVRDLRKAVLGTNHSQYAFVLSTLADLQARTGNPGEAVKTGEEALGILKATLGPDHPRYPNHLITLATHYMALRRVDRVDDLVEEALPLLENAEGKASSEYASALNLIANMYRGARPEFAADLFEKACGIWRELDDPLQYAIARDNLGRLYVSLGKFVEAERLHREALKIFQSLLGEQHPTTARGLGNLSALQFAKKEYDKAVETQRQAVHASRFNLALASGSQTEVQQLVAFDSLRLDLDKFLTWFSYSSESPERAWEEVLAWKGQTLNQQRDSRLARTMPALQPLVTKLRRVTAQLASLALSSPSSAEQRRWREHVDRLTREREDLEEQLVAAIAKERGGKPLPPHTPARIRAALPESAVLVDFFVYRHAILDNEKRPPGRYLLAFVVKHGQPVALVDLGRVEPIGEAVDRWLKDYGKDSGTALQKALWRPLEKHLAGTETILVSPDGPLTRFPFAALPGKHAGSYLIEDVRVAVVPVPRLLPELLGGEEKAQGQLSLLLAGDINFDASPGRAPTPLASIPRPPSTEEILERAPKSERPREPGRVLSFDPIPATREEVSAIAKVFDETFKKKPDNPLTGKEATEEAIRTAAPGKTYLHLATHGFFAPARLRSALAPADELLAPMTSRRVTRTHPALLSGIALAGANRGPRGDPQLDDGILTAAELAEIDLTTARLVVLSACSTGLGDTAGGEGLLGLQRALHVAGARSAITSFWKVPDDATRALMTEFYTNLWSRKMPTLDALREAQLAVMKNYDVRKKEIPRGPRGERPIVPKDGPRLSPFFWAGFALSGDWR